MSLRGQQTGRCKVARDPPENIPPTRPSMANKETVSFGPFLPFPDALHPQHSPRVTLWHQQTGLRTLSCSRPVGPVTHQKRHPPCWRLRRSLPTSLPHPPAPLTQPPRTHISSIPDLLGTSSLQLLQVLWSRRFFPRLSARFAPSLLPTYAQASLHPNM